MGEQQFDNIPMSAADGIADGIGVGGGDGFGLVGIGTLPQEELHEVQVAVGGGGEELPDAFEVAKFGGGGDVVVCTPGDEVADEEAVTLRGLGWKVTPAAIGLIAVCEVDGLSAIGTHSVGVGPTIEQLIDDRDLACHYGPVDGEATGLASGVEELRLRSWMSMARGSPAPETL